MTDEEIEEMLGGEGDLDDCDWCFECDRYRGEGNCRQCLLDAGGAARERERSLIQPNNLDGPSAQEKL